MTTLARNGAPVAAARGHYLYAVSDEAPAWGAGGLKGLDGGDVYAVEADGLAVVVSDVGSPSVRPERRKLAAHHEVLRRLMAGGATVLPMAFGLIASSADDVRRIVRLNRDAFAGQLDRVRGRVEMGVRVAWDVPNVFEMMIAEHPELGELRDHMFRGGRQPSQDEMIDLGRRFDRLVAADREECVERASEVLRNYCAEVASNPPRNEREVMNLACLVDRGRVAEFDHAVVEAAGRFDDRFAFDFNGPWPPHNFVSLELRTS